MNTKQAIANVKKQVELISTEQIATLTSHGIDKDKFSLVVAEALITNPNIINANQTELARSLRQCCQDGLIPNGREAVITVNKHGGVQYLAMRDGYCKIIHRLLGASIESGYVTKGQNVRIKKQAGYDDTVEIDFDFGAAESDDIIGAWCWLKVPNQPAFVHTFTKSDIEKAQAASRVKGDGPWKLWKGRMAEKAVVKSAMRKAVYMFPTLDDKVIDEINRVFGEENEAPVVIEGESHEVEAVTVVDEAPKPKATTKKETKPQETREQAPVDDNDLSGLDFSMD